MEITDVSGNSVITFPDDIFTTTSTMNAGSVIKFNATNYAYSYCGSVANSRNVQNSASAQTTTIEYMNGTKIIRTTCEIVLILSRLEFV